MYDSLMDGEVENCGGCLFHEYKLICVTITFEDMNNVGKTVFLSREEAEKALKKEAGS